MHKYKLWLSEKKVAFRGREHRDTLGIKEGAGNHTQACDAVFPVYPSVSMFLQINGWAWRVRIHRSKKEVPVNFWFATVNRILIMLPP